MDDTLPPRQRTQLMALVPRGDMQGCRLVAFVLAFRATHPPLAPESLAATLAHAAETTAEPTLRRELRRLGALLEESETG